MSGYPWTTVTPVVRRAKRGDVAASTVKSAGRRFLRVLQWSADVLEEFAGWYCGKSSPVHLFWHSFDLATSRFSGRRAERRSLVDAVTAEAYSHEVISFGFWAGDRTNPFPAYYSYTAPEPVELRGAAPAPRPSRARVPAERLRSGSVARGLGSRRHGHAVAPRPNRSAHSTLAPAHRNHRPQTRGLVDSDKQGRT